MFGYMYQHVFQAIIQDVIRPLTGQYVSVHSITMYSTVQYNTVLYKEAKTIAIHVVCAVFTVVLAQC